MIVPTMMEFAHKNIVLESKDRRVWLRKLHDKANPPIINIINIL